MDKSKVKNFIILLLAIVNAFLLFIVLRSASEQRSAREYAKNALESALERNSITMSDKVVLPEDIPTEITLSRSMLKEKRKLSSLIGSCSAQDLGGNIVFYKGSDGQASFRGTGEFEIVMESAIIPVTSDPVAICHTVAGKLGIECSDDAPEIINDGSGLSVIINCAWEGTPVYNASIRFDFTSDRLFVISGMRPLDTEVSIRAVEEYPDSATILMSFLGYIRSGGEACSEITDVQLGYFITSSASGSCVLRPVWCIMTDSGKYFINGQTGKPENLEYAA